MGGPLGSVGIGGQADGWGAVGGGLVWEGEGRGGESGVWGDPRSPFFAPTPLLPVKGKSEGGVEVGLLVQAWGGANGTWPVGEGSWVCLQWYANCLRRRASLGPPPPPGKMSLVIGGRLVRGHHFGRPRITRTTPKRHGNTRGRDLGGNLTTSTSDNFSYRRRQLPGGGGNTFRGYHQRDWTGRRAGPAAPKPRGWPPGYPISGAEGEKGSIRITQRPARRFIYPYCTFLFGQG